MLCDIEITPGAFVAAAADVHVGPDAAPVRLLVDDTMLLVSQGDVLAAYDTDGSPGSEEYLAKAPLDREPLSDAALLHRLNVLVHVAHDRFGPLRAGAR